MTNIKITNEAYEKLREMKNKLSLSFSGVILELTKPDSKDQRKV